LEPAATHRTGEQKVAAGNLQAFFLGPADKIRNNTRMVQDLVFLGTGGLNHTGSMTREGHPLKMNHGAER